VPLHPASSAVALRSDQRRACTFYDARPASCPARIAIDGSCAISSKTVSAAATTAQPDGSATLAGAAADRARGADMRRRHLLSIGLPA
jgi:hypothetical protein